ncbi:hypothetical protein AGOR_G00111310 [Albula goreensis]|uniref:Uncharacterized protein n=1 Tax=Albula goreensis TaxID=1534307 RepID=A0A8T3DIJ4_9TELE|nr:hypothetical protein AGOR_G00111310 [Albula goreensis]
MLSRLPKLTPGYIRYLQTASVQKPADRMADFGMSRLAVLLGVLGVVVSGYSSRQLTLHHKPSARILQWGRPLPGTTGGREDPQNQARRCRGAIHRDAIV